MDALWGMQRSMHLLAVINQKIRSLLQLQRRRAFPSSQMVFWGSTIPHFDGTIRAEYHQLQRLWKPFSRDDGPSCILLPSSLKLIIFIVKYFEYGLSRLMFQNCKVRWRCHCERMVSRGLRTEKDQLQCLWKPFSRNDGPSFIPLPSSLKLIIFIVKCFDMDYPD